MKLVIIESPLAGDVDANVAYAKRCLADSLVRGEAPYASHLLYPHVLDDTVPNQRELGINAGFAWGDRADLVAVYVDRGVSRGMEQGVARALAANQPIEFRSLDGADLADYPPLNCASTSKGGKRRPGDAVNRCEYCGTDLDLADELGQAFGHRAEDCREYLKAALGAANRRVALLEEAVEAVARLSAKDVAKLPWETIRVLSHVASLARQDPAP